VRQLCDVARSIINADHPKTRSDINRIRRRIAKLLHPDLGRAMNAELDEMVFGLAA
jgi:curved DNA-binding protein CbpA